MSAVQFVKRNIQLFAAVTFLMAGCTDTSVVSTPLPTNLSEVVTPQSTETPEEAEEPTQTPTPFIIPEPEIPAYEPYAPESGGQVIRIPADYATIQEGIKAAGDGDLILAVPGHYMEQIDFLGKNIVVSSEEGPGETIIDAGRAGSTVTFANGETSEAVLHGFAITNGVGRSQGSNPENFPFGGGIVIRNASPVISHCIITGNGATFGGGIYIEGSQASPHILNNVISQNIASERAGGIQVKDGASPVIQNNLITENITMDAGGIEFINGSSGILEGNLISGNMDGYDFSEEHIEKYLDGQPVTQNMGHSLSIPGGVMVTNGSYPEIRGNVIKNNEGGGMGVVLGSHPVIVGNEFRQNTGWLADGILIGMSSNPVLSGNNIYAADSPAVRMDTGSSILTTDQIDIEHEIPDYNMIVGKLSFGYGFSDVDEAPFSRMTLSVPEDFATIQEAISASAEGDSIIVSPGIYEEQLDFLGKAIQVISTDPDDPEIVESTVITASNGPTVVFRGNESTHAELEGFFITNTGDFPAIQILEGAEPTLTGNIIAECNSFNGAIFISKTGSPRIVGNEIRDNHGRSGLQIYYASPVVEGNLFDQNSGGIGAGLYAYFSSPVITGNTFSNNRTTGYGSAIQIEHYSAGQIKGNTFVGNEAEMRGTISLDDFAIITIEGNRILDNLGGGISIIFDSQPLIINNVIARNVGGGIFVGIAEAEIINNTMVDNRKGGDDDSAGESRGIFIMENSSIYITNTILDHSKIYLFDSFSQVEAHSLLIYEDWPIEQPGSENLFAAPGFENTVDYHLSDTSPCIDAGVEVELDTDLEGNPRPAGEGYDIGAYEYQP